MRLAPVVAALLAAAALAAPAHARTWDQTWTGLSAHPTIHVQTNDARVRLHAGGAGRVEASVEYTLQVWGLHSTVREPEVTFERKGDTITVVARSRANVVLFFGGVNERFHVDVTVPADCDVRVRTGDGSIESEAVRGNIDLQTGDGHLTVHGAHGNVRLWTGDGGIDADGIDGALDAHTSDGHLRVAGRFDRLDLRSGDGRVEATVNRGSALAQAWSLSSGDGGITVRIPRDLQALLDAEAHDGHVRVDLPIDTQGLRGRHELRGQLNGGRVPLVVRTGDGPITLALSE